MMSPVNNTVRDALAGIGVYLLARRMLPFVIIGGLILGCCLCQFWFGTLSLGLRALGVPVSTSQPVGPTSGSQPIVPVGTVVRLTPLQIAVQGGERVTRAASTDLVAVYLQIENITATPAPVDRGRFVLQDNRGGRHLPLVRPDLTVFGTAPAQFNPADPIPAGEQIDAVFVYEVPRDAFSLLLRIGGTLFATGLP